MELKLVYWEYLWVVWIFSSVLFIRFYIHIAHYRTKLISKVTKEKFGTPRLIFQVTTKGNIPIVQNTVDRINEVCKEIGYDKYDLWVVTDAQEQFQNCRTIIVPTQFSCNAIYKGRALQYAVELRKEEGKNTQEISVFHLDDESLITKQTLCSILTYLEGNPKPISEGLITYPLREKAKIKFPHLMDTLRPFCCFECMDFMNTGKPAYIHGSNLLIRSDIEEKVGWQNGKTLAEDTLFAIQAKKKIGSEAFGWHGGVVEEQSPLNFRDLMKQRKRWFYGLIQNLKYLSRMDKVSQSFRAVLWTSGFISGIASILAWTAPLFNQPYQQIPVEFKILFTITSIMWLLSYQVGVLMNGKYLSLKRRVEFHFMTLLFSIPIGLIECAVPLISVISKPKSFEVIKK
jgi:egghead protein (zeste-white 4 protein)